VFGLTVLTQGQPIIGGAVQAAITFQSFQSPYGQPALNPFGPFGKGTITLLTGSFYSYF
jgi:hypothetical protein